MGNSKGIIANHMADIKGPEKTGHRDVIMECCEKG